MIKTIDELITQATNLLGENATSDEGISLIENLTDTFTDASKNSSIDWKEKYETNDREWRNKYLTRFSQGSSTPETEEVEVKEKEIEKEETVPTKFNELFTNERSK